MPIRNYIVPFIFVAFLSYSSLAQHRFKASITFPKDVETSLIKIYYDDGIDNSVKLDTLIDSPNITFTRPFSSQYATIFILYKNIIRSFWVQNGYSKIEFLPNNESPLSSYNLENAISVDDSDMKVAMDEFISDELNAMSNFKNINKTWNTTDSLVRIFEALNTKIYLKKLHFIKNNSLAYFSFWTFRREIIYTDIDIDTLLNTFKGSFPTSIQSSLEGKEALKILNGRGLKKDKPAIEFASTDISNNPILLSSFKNKYVILNFWASWCGPCIAEMPVLKKIHQLVSSNDLEIINITLDEDFSNFKYANKELEIPGIHIFNDINILKYYGIISIPQVYLISPSGIVMYSRSEEKDFHLKMLEKIVIDTIIK